MRFSVEEKRDLVKAWVAISLAVSIAIIGFDAIKVLGLSLLVRAFVIYAFTVGASFLAHEVLGHKFAAQRSGLAAEFRADDLFLMVAILTSFAGFVFAVPGAVVVSGVTRIDTYGKIAAAGPMVNIILAILFGLLVRAGVTFSLAIYPGQTVDLIGISHQINSWWALFNLIPLGIWDGAKVLAWNRTVWAFMAGVSALLFLGII